MKDIKIDISAAGFPSQFVSDAKKVLFTDRSGNTI